MDTVQQSPFASRKIFSRPMKKMSSIVPIYENRVVNDRFTIYSRIGQRSQTWGNLTPGKSIIIPLPEQANLESIVVFQQNNERDIQAIRHTLVTNTQSFPLSSSQSVDQEVESFSGNLTVEVRKDSDRYRGVLLDVGVDNVVIWGTKNDCGHQEVVQIRDYKVIIMITSGKGGHEHDDQSQGLWSQTGHTLRYITLTPITNGPLTVNYLMDGLRWEAHHTVVIDTVDETQSNRATPENDRVVFWRLGGTIYNQNNIPFIASDVVLMAGAINEPVSRRQSSVQKMSIQPASYDEAANFTGVSNEAIPSSVEDFVAFRLQETPLRIDSASLSRSNRPGITNVEVVSYGGFDVRKMYRCSIIDDRYYNDNNGLPAEALYRFDAEMFIPAGQAIMYRMSRDEVGGVSYGNTQTRTGGGVGPLIGAVQIRETQPQDEVDLLLGRSTKVRCETVVTREVRLVAVTTDRTQGLPRLLNNGENSGLLTPQRSRSPRQVEDVGPIAESVVISTNGDGQSPTTQTRSKVPYYRHTKVSFTTQIINRNTRPIILILTYPKGDQPIEKVDCEVPHIVKSDRLEWMVRVEPTSNKPSQFSCSFVIREGPFQPTTN